MCPWNSPCKYPDISEPVQGRVKSLSQLKITLLNNLISFLFPKLLELIFIHKNTPPKVWNAKMGLKSFFLDTLYLQDWNEC